MARVVSFTAPGRVEVLDEPVPSLGPDGVRVRTLHSGISAGTELTAFRGTNPYLVRRWDEASRLFVAGPSTVEYPITGWGYEEVGRVVEVGPEAYGVAPGDVVWGAWGHRTETVLPASDAARQLLPGDADPIVGIFAQIGGIALNVVLDGDIHVGETVAVFGLGVPGQLVAQLARLNGARVVAVDGMAARRRLAADLGADVVVDPAAGDVAARIRALTDGRGADVALEVTGSHAALHEAIRSVAYNARVCAAGFMQGDGIGLRLGEEFHHNRVQVVSTQISGVSPTLQHRWDRHRLDATAIALAAAGRLRVADLVTHRIPLEEAADAYALLDADPGAALQVVLECEPPS